MDECAYNNNNNKSTKGTVCAYKNPLSVLFLFFLFLLLSVGSLYISVHRVYKRPDHHVKNDIYFLRERE